MRTDGETSAVNYEGRKDLLRSETMKKFVFFGGKGGVGKTTSSSAYSYYCSRKGIKTLVVSTDPAHSLSDIFSQEIGSEITMLSKNLFGLEIDPEEESLRYINKIKSNLSKTVSRVIVNEIEKQLDAAYVSPGSEESAVFDKMVEIINTYGDDFDKIVFDTAPTGHTLRLMSLPELMGSWIDRLIKKRKHAVELMEMSNRQKRKNLKEIVKEDPIIKILSERKSNFERVRKVLLDDRLINFVFVMNPEKLPLEETKKAVKILDKYSIPVNAIIVNKILPENDSSEFWMSRRDLEKRYIEEIESYFSSKEIIQIPLLSTDVGPEHIKEISSYYERLYYV